MSTPEELARQNIYKQLEACGWIVQSRRSLNLYDGRDPEPRSPRVFDVRRPETLADCLLEGDTLRLRLCNMPARKPLITTNLW